MAWRSDGCDGEARMLNDGASGAYTAVGHETVTGLGHTCTF